MRPLKRSVISVLLAALLLISLANLTRAETTNSSSYTPWHTGDLPWQFSDTDQALENKAIDFLTNVFNYDISGYNITNLVVGPAAEGLGAGLDIQFKANRNMIDLETGFTVDGDIFWCSVYTEGSVSYNTPPSSDVLSTAKDTLTRIQAISAEDNIPVFERMLQNVTEANNSTVTNANFMQTVTAANNEVTIKWQPYANGLSYAADRYELDFQTGNLTGFFNALPFYNIVSSDVEITQQQAIQMATAQVEAYSYVNGNQTVSNFSIAQAIAPVATLSFQIRGSTSATPKMLYPE